MHPSTGYCQVFDPPYQTASVQFCWPLPPPPLELNVRLPALFVPRIPLRLQVAWRLAPLVKLSIDTPDGSETPASTKNALLNRLSGAASALTWRSTPELSLPTASMCQIGAAGSSVALYVYEPAFPSVFVFAGMFDPTTVGM